jgi:hypothetical protein
VDMKVFVSALGAAKVDLLGQNEIWFCSRKLSKSQLAVAMKTATFIVFEERAWEFPNNSRSAT